MKKYGLMFIIWAPALLIIIATAWIQLLFNVHLSPYHISFILSALISSGVMSYIYATLVGRNFSARTQKPIVIAFSGHSRAALRTYIRKITYDEDEAKMVLENENGPKGMISIYEVDGHLIGVWQ
ncbi:hypothetical protein MsAg5_13060 [Methanosarcinaceae archaeon Ag5]|uniref:Uncharacterized protein n=1 Tax=Methanolapillus africanus TaxID=3028297 RepID=A0AAE4SDD9_9EURY|nr:hypothetical protein [Methanosarcinaceae archaeon Ag5]